ncbi:hypothetical protein [Enterovirga sp.]|uniref:hypothetical protein n=1 Tax=Enterovirga sp. TaxID=2026350 RepID=UPI00261495DB|nr:hypothetical protein [Enterovirga sp.]MDB5592511.1 hypothetical protein [Enterovirga sp.]
MDRVAKRRMSETWREAVAGRCAGAEPLAAYDAMVAGGMSEAEAAFRALAAAGLLWAIEEPITAAAPDQAVTSGRAAG